MDGCDLSWDEGGWDSSAEDSWRDEINDAIEEAAMSPFDDPGPDNLEAEDAPGWEDACPVPPAYEPETPADAIRDAIDEASSRTQFDPWADGPLPVPESDDPLGHCTEVFPQWPDGADVILLDILPISTTTLDEHGRVQIEPDPSSLDSRGIAGRDQAEHLVSWLNATGDARGAIEHAVRTGEARLEFLMREYDEHLAEAGYDHSAPDVERCHQEIRHLHESIEHAKEVLDDLHA